MEIVRGVANLKSHHRGSVVTIGNFDGVHRGHQALLGQIREKSDKLGVPSMLVCFEPQPKEYFDEFSAPARLTRFREKVRLLEQYGVDIVFCMKFDDATRSMHPDDFTELLGDKIGVSALFVGDDFHFGQDRSGNFETLVSAGEQYGFEVSNLRTMIVGDDRVSSTRIRECLAAGEFEEAEALLGHAYSIMGKVVYGRQLGRTLDAPTANIQLHRYRAPISGVYAVEMDGLDRRYQGVANVGVRPTLNEKTVKPALEVHLFDFSGTIYGRNVEVIFRHKIRDEKKYDGLDELKAAIAGDIDAAKSFFAGPDVSQPDVTESKRT
jgi:riboflavin kinase/FMN adenylyltransferase